MTLQKNKLDRLFFRHLVFFNIAPARKFANSFVAIVEVLPAGKHEQCSLLISKASESKEIPLILLISCRGGGIFIFN
ncbi:MAG: hypothetical protein PHH77_06735 [Victivallaceae bacterium]|nr:hypothetical protein [Victivallaceae bacterium]